MKKFYLLLLGINFVFSGCGKFENTKKVFSMDGVKLISSAISGMRDPRLFNQTEYTISPTQRLLLRYEKFLEEAKTVSIEDKHDAYLIIALAENTDKKAAFAHLKLCPVTTNWMMLATWHQPHPFKGEFGKWNTPGGDFHERGCMSLKSLSEEKIGFDIKQWIEDYPKGRSLNYGFILISGIPIQIYGDASQSFSPRLQVYGLTKVEDYFQK